MLNSIIFWTKTEKDEKTLYIVNPYFVIMEISTLIPIIIAIFGFLIMILSVILKDITYSDRIIRNTVFLMIIGTLMVFTSFFFSTIMTFLSNSIFVYSILLIPIFLLILTFTTLSIARSPRISFITWIIIIITFIITLMFIGLIWFR